VADLGSGCHDLALIDGGRIVFRGSPGNLVAAARGKVFELVLPTEREVPLGPGIEVVSRTREGATTRVRAVSTDGRLPDGAEAVEGPTLEEGYLVFMASRGRAEAALTEEQA
jgi:hypothetical protein